ncbi:MAG: zf-HC2 domain-containing protein [Acidobacteriia bacterium]|nr:zf-HC2 domain-containing protein [Terriglobia bacterium]
MTMEKHPTTEQLVGLLDGTAEAGERAALEAHLQGCTSCRGQLDRLRRTVDLVKESEGRRAGGTWYGAAREAHAREVAAVPLGIRLARHWPAWAGFAAAAVVLVVLTYPAYLGVIRLPIAERQATGLLAEKGQDAAQIRELRSSLDGVSDRLRRATEWGGAVELHILPSALRGGRPATLEVNAGQPFVLLGVTPQLPGLTASTRRFVFAIAGPAAQPLWSCEMSASEITARVNETNVVTLAVPGSLLPPGRFELRVAPVDAGGGEPLLRIPFEIVRRK